MRRIHSDLFPHSHKCRTWSPQAPAALLSSDRCESVSYEWPRCHRDVFWTDADEEQQGRLDEFARTAVMLRSGQESDFRAFSSMFGSHRAAVCVPWGKHLSSRSRAAATCGCLLRVESGHLTDHSPALLHHGAFRVPGRADAIFTVRPCGVSENVVTRIIRAWQKKPATITTSRRVTCGASRSNAASGSGTSTSLISSRTTLIYKRTKNIRAIQLLLGHTKLESTVRYLGIEVDDALEISEQTEI
jgi:hypothetical protein